MTWNYRIIRHPAHPNNIHAGIDGSVLSIHEVYYNNDIPNGYGPPVVLQGESVSDLKFALTKMIEALDKEILNVKDLG